MVGEVANVRAIQQPGMVLFGTLKCFGFFWKNTLEKGKKN